MKAKEIPQLENEQIGSFIKKIEFTDSCWLWKGSIGDNGYGEIYMFKDDFKAHRVSYEVFKKVKIPVDLVLDHLCRNRSCVNPFHLEVVSQSENIHRGVGVAAINKQKTHCYRGHPIMDESQYNKHTNNKFGKVWRECKVCRSESNRRYRQNIKERLSG